MKRKKRSMKEIVNASTPKLSKEKVDEIGDRVWKRLEAEMDKRKDQLAYRSLYGDGWTVPKIDQDDFHVLSAISPLAPEASAKAILSTIEKWTDRPPIVALALQTLESQGSIKSTGSGDHQRFELTERGRGSLVRARAEGKQLVVAVSSAEAKAKSLDDAAREKSRS